MSNEHNTRIMERFYETVEDNNDLTEEEIMSMDLEDMWEYLIGKANEKINS